MNDMVKKLIALATLASSLALVGCAAATPERRDTFTTIAPVIPTPTSAADVRPAASGIVDTVWVEVYPENTFKSKRGCQCTLPDSTQELFPAGTPVLLVKITMTGEWKPSQGNTNSQDVTGTTLDGTKFDGRPERAVLDTADGPGAAKAAGLPWLPSGLFHGEAVWTIPNKQPQAFVAAWYLPPGVDRLLLTVNVPAEGQPNHLVVPLPTTAIRATNTDGE
ncbi:hypothetical protein [Diaminobutyricibacter sp. McL0608]|uniref:hypothetical protein n=1 Tax=Leifsonia sp. McL0608 TaxID=3143537 RepID=UPI0031F33464